MKFSAVIALLLPLSSILASPVADSGPIGIIRDEHITGTEPLSVDQSEADLVGRDLFARSTRKCKIVNVSNRAFCRSGPGTNYLIKYSVYKGQEYKFDCYKKGTCYEGNCTWDRLLHAEGYYYVSSAYTDSRCTKAALRKC
ncbi:hypothetical protein DER46DRAFT_398826 [Fusarium sp. MPI-SDFR-AT-0072]|nr:hypothetical protein DER46DRAFT_398826 [Fusarium sp. MPI-SDFR-AT-0072]